MPLFEFVCQDCSLVFELLIRNNKEIPKCKKCESTNLHRSFPKVNFNIQGISKNSSIDLVVGRDAEHRWKLLEERKKVKEQIRNETGDYHVSQILESKSKKISYKPTPAFVKKDREQTIKKAVDNGIFTIGKDIYKPAKQVNPKEYNKAEYSKDGLSGRLIKK
jgi:putative FmdB family regulatory protein